MLGDEWETMQALNDEPLLFLALKEGHLDVVRALLEVGGRPAIALMTSNDGVSCLYISPKKGHLARIFARFFRQLNIHFPN